MLKVGTKVKTSTNAYGEVVIPTSNDEKTWDLKRFPVMVRHHDGSRLPYSEHYVKEISIEEYNRSKLLYLFEKVNYNLYKQTCESLGIEYKEVYYSEYLSRKNEFEFIFKGKSFTKDDIKDYDICFDGINREWVVKNKVLYPLFTTMIDDEEVQLYPMKLEEYSQNLENEEYLGDDETYNITKVLRGNTFVYVR